jgi:hypothetical protein
MTPTPPFSANGRVSSGDSTLLTSRDAITDLLLV